MQNHQELEETFHRLGIDFTKPGFCDSPEFQTVERKYPLFLKAYADFIQTSQYSAEYLDRARHIVQNTAEFLFNELAEDGRKGACIDISGLTLRFLERQGIWCNVVCGGVKVEFPKDSGIVARYFYPLMHEDNKAFTGHAWIYAPPFSIVDLSISLQPYSTNEQPYFHGYILAEKCNPPVAPIKALDLMEGELVDEHVRRFRRLPTMDDLSPELRTFMSEYPPLSISKGQLQFTYMPVKISAPEQPLEGMIEPTLSGRRPIDVFKRFQSCNRPPKPQ